MQSISSVLNEVQELIDKKMYRMKQWDLFIGEKYLFDGVCFIAIYSDDICYDEHMDVLVYLPRSSGHNMVIIPENDKTDLFNFIVQYNVSTENIKTFREVLKLYKTAERQNNISV